MNVLSSSISICFTSIIFFQDPGEIGVISPYNAQNKKLRQLDVIKTYREALKAGTVESFQAQVRSILSAEPYNITEPGPKLKERPVIIMSTVRSNPDQISFDIRHSLGFVAHAKRLNGGCSMHKSCGLYRIIDCLLFRSCHHESSKSPHHCRRPRCPLTRPSLE